MDRLNPEPFNMRTSVPENATIKRSPPERWWRSDSPDRDGSHPDLPKAAADPALSATRGVLGGGRRSGPILFQTQSQTGTGTASHFKMDPEAPSKISGYSGHIAGKQAGNCIGGTFDEANRMAETHLKTTTQTLRFPGVSKPHD